MSRARAARIRHRPAPAAAACRATLVEGDTRIAFAAGSVLCETPGGHREGQLAPEVAARLSALIQTTDRFLAVAFAPGAGTPVELRWDAGRGIRHALVTPGSGRCPDPVVELIEELRGVLERAAIPPREQGGRTLD